MAAGLCWPRRAPSIAARRGTRTSQSRWRRRHDSILRVHVVLALLLLQKLREFIRLKSREFLVALAPMVRSELAIHHLDHMLPAVEAAMNM